MPKFHFIVIELERTEHDTFAGGFFLPFARSVLEQTKVSVRIAVVIETTCPKPLEVKSKPTPISESLHMQMKERLNIIVPAC